MSVSLVSLLLPALNHVVAAEGWAQERLRTHAGACVAIAAGPISFLLQVDSHGLFRTAEPRTQPDVTLTLPGDTPLRIMLDRQSAFASVRLEGSADIAETLAFVFRNLRWDIESDLARLVGDIAARRIVLHGRSLAGSLVEAVRRTGKNVKEYAAEDSSMLVSQREFTAFADQLAALGSALDALENRLAARAR